MRVFRTESRSYNCSQFSYPFSIERKRIETKTEYKRKGVLTYDTTLQERHKRKKKCNSIEFVRILHCT
mgnify:CR=1 FL=1